MGRRNRVEVGSTNLKKDIENMDNIVPTTSPRPPNGGRSIKIKARPKARILRNTFASAAKTGSLNKKEVEEPGKTSLPLTQKLPSPETPTNQTQSGRPEDGGNWFDKEDEVGTAEEVCPFKIPVIPKPKTAPPFPQRRLRRHMTVSPPLLRRRALRTQPRPPSGTASTECQRPRSNKSFRRPLRSGSGAGASVVTNIEMGSTTSSHKSRGASELSQPTADGVAEPGDENKATVANKHPENHSNVAEGRTDLAAAPASKQKFDRFEAENTLRERIKLATIERAKKSLQEIAMTRCGTATKFYQLFDADRNENITFDEFSRGLALYNLDSIFPRSVQSLVFDTIDKDRNGHVDLAELEDFLQIGHMVTKKADSVRLPTPIEETRDIQELKVKMSTQCREKCPKGSMARHLVKTFRFVDFDNNGFLDKDEMRRCIGPECLNISLTPEETEKAIEAMSPHGDGIISFQDFFRWFQYEYNEPTYNVIHNGRAKHKRELEALVAHMEDPKDTAAEAQRKVRMKELDEALFRNEKRAQTIPLSPIKMERTLTKEPPNPEDGYPNLTKIAEDFARPDAKEDSFSGLQSPLLHQSVKFRSTAPAHSSQDIFKGVSCSQRLPVRHSQLARFRKMGEIAQNTWPNISLGGSVDPNSSMYGNNFKRFTTTTQEMSFDSGVPQERRSNFDEEVQKKAQTRRFREQSQKLHKERMELGIQLRHDKEKQILGEKTKINATRMMGYLKAVDAQDMWALREISGSHGFSKRPDLKARQRIFGSQIVT